MNRSQENADPSAYIDEFDIQAIVKVSFEIMGNRHYV